MKQPVKITLSEKQQEMMRGEHGRVYVEKAAGELYFYYMQCLTEGNAFPEDLKTAHALLWRHLGREEALREKLYPSLVQKGTLSSENEGEPFSPISPRLAGLGGENAPGISHDTDAGQD